MHKSANECRWSLLLCFHSLASFQFNYGQLACCLCDYITITGNHRQYTTSHSLAFHEHSDIHHHHSHPRKLNKYATSLISSEWLNRHLITFALSRSIFTWPMSVYHLVSLPHRYNFGLFSCSWFIHSFDVMLAYRLIAVVAFELVACNNKRSTIW